jgi:hypothetical protein
MAYNQEIQQARPFFGMFGFDFSFGTRFRDSDTSIAFD